MFEKKFHAVCLTDAPCPAPRRQPLGDSPPGLQTDRPRPTTAVAFTNPFDREKERGTRYDLNSSAEIEAERVRGPPGFAVTAKAAN